MRLHLKFLFNLLILSTLLTSLFGTAAFTTPARAESNQPDNANSTLDLNPELTISEFDISRDPVFRPLATPNTWDSAAAGLNGRVNRMVMVGKDLYAAGEFTDAGGVAEADYLAKWDGTAWSALGTIPLNSYVFTLATNGTDLYVAGDFNNAGGIDEADRFAKWDGTNWSAVGPALIGDVYAIAISGTDIYVGGNFTNASGDANADYIAKLTGGVGTWSALGTGTNGNIYSIAFSGTDVYVSGQFTSAGGVVDTSRIAKWDGATWSALGTGMDNTVYVVAVNGANVYAGGDFSSAGGVADTSGIAKFSGGSWSPLGSGLPFSYIRDIALIDGDVFVGGYFPAVDGNADIKHLAKFSGGTWSALGAIAGSGQVDAIAISPGGESIYAGGAFTDWAGNANANYIARFEPASTTITVNTNADELNVDGDCSLREAMQSAELNTATDACAVGNASGPDIIVFHNSLGTASILLNANLPELSKTYGLTILGGGDITVDGDNTYRMFVVGEKAYLKIDGLTVSWGNAGGNNYGGGLANNSGYVVITNSTFLSNTAYGSGAVDNLSGDMVIANSTFSGNTSTGDSGSAIYNYQGRMTIANSTLFGNTPVISGASALVNQDGVLRMYNTIIANTINGVDCSLLTGTLTGNNNLIESTGVGACGLTNGVDGNIIGVDPALGSLTGSPAYFPLNAGSPAIDTGDDTVCANAPVNNTSQNGVTRPLGAHCDIGAYEFSDYTLPTVTSSIRVSTNPTNLASVDFTVTFSEPVTGVDLSDFSLTTSGVSSAAVSGLSGTGSVYTVTVNTGSGSGTIRLNVLDDDTIKDDSLNPLGAGLLSGQTYTIEKSAPIVSSSIRANANPTNLASVDFTVTFSEPVIGVDLSDFSLTTSGVSSPAVSGLSGSGSVYTVTVNTGSGNGTIRLNVLDDNSIIDAVSNPLFAGFTSGETYTVSKAATVATFSDVPLTYWASSYIERLFNAGITGGCGTDIYCPDNSVTRAQMAIFLLKGIHGSSYAPPAVGVSTGFGDVATDYWAAAWIKQLAAEGITGGCGGGNYCPDNVVTRAQMAIFLLKARNGSGYTPPAVGVSTGFNDVATDAFGAAFIKQLVADGITAGCGNSNYCPNDSVTRAQMAVFLVRAFNLP